MRLCYGPCVFQSPKTHCLKIKVSPFPILFRELYWQDTLGLRWSNYSSLFEFLLSQFSHTRFTLFPKRAKISSTLPFLLFIPSYFWSELNQGLLLFKEYWDQNRFKWPRSWGVSPASTSDFVFSKSWWKTSVAFLSRLRLYSTIDRFSGKKVSMNLNRINSWLSRLMV